MDAATAYMLENLPHHLKDRGWTFVPEDSGPYLNWYKVVYERPYDPDIDSDVWATPTPDGYVRVSTNQSQPPTWDQAYKDAIENMEFIDDKRLHGR